METLTVKEIHNSFKNIDIRLLNSPFILSELNRLEYLGFGSCNKIQEFNKYLANSGNPTLRQELALYEYIKTNYPGYSIISKESLTKLCKNYNFVLRSSLEFIGDIPNENLKVIETFVKLHQNLNYDSRIPKFTMVAPEAFFDETITKTIDDPLVLMKFSRQDGIFVYIIITAWGSEELALNIFNN